MTPSRRLLLAVLAALSVLPTLLGAGSADADEIVMRNGKTHRGYPREVGRELRLNVFGCSVPEGR